MIHISGVEVIFGSTFTLSCSVEGGLAPHKVDLTKPKTGGSLTWTRAAGFVLFYLSLFLIVNKYILNSELYI